MCEAESLRILRGEPRHSKPETSMLVSATTRIGSAPCLSRGLDLSLHFFLSKWWTADLGKAVARFQKLIHATPPQFVTE